MSFKLKTACTILAATVTLGLAGSVAYAQNQQYNQNQYPCMGDGSCPMGGHIQGGHMQGRHMKNKHGRDGYDAKYQCTNVPQAQWMSMEQLSAQASKLGYTLDEIKFRGSCVKVEGYDRNGAEVELIMNPATGEVIPYEQIRQQRLQMRQDMMNNGGFVPGQRMAPNNAAPRGSM